MCKTCKERHHKRTVESFQPKFFSFLVRRSFFGGGKGFYLWRKRFFCARLVAHFLADSVSWVICLKSRAGLAINSRLWIICHMFMCICIERKIWSIPICFSTSLICTKDGSSDSFLCENIGILCMYGHIFGYMPTFGWPNVEKI